MLKPLSFDAFRAAVAEAARDHHPDQSKAIQIANANRDLPLYDGLSELEALRFRQGIEEAVDPTGTWQGFADDVSTLGGHHECYCAETVEEPATT
jgi:hypothetical protein